MESESRAFPAKRDRLRSMLAHRGDTGSATALALKQKLKNIPNLGIRNKAAMLRLRRKHGAIPPVKPLDTDDSSECEASDGDNHDPSSDEPSVTTTDEHEDVSASSRDWDDTDDGGTSSSRDGRSAGHRCRGGGFPKHTGGVKKCLMEARASTRTSRFRRLTPSAQRFLRSDGNSPTGRRRMRGEGGAKPPSGSTSTSDSESEGGGRGARNSASDNNRHFLLPSGKFENKFGSTLVKQRTKGKDNMGLHSRDAGFLHPQRWLQRRPKSRRDRVNNVAAGRRPWISRKGTQAVGAMENMLYASLGGLLGCSWPGVGLGELPTFGCEHDEVSEMYLRTKALKTSLLRLSNHQLHASLLPLLVTVSDIDISETTEICCLVTHRPTGVTLGTPSSNDHMSNHVY